MGDSYNTEEISSSDIAAQKDEQDDNNEIYEMNKSPYHSKK